MRLFSEIGASSDKLLQLFNINRSIDDNKSYDRKYLHFKKQNLNFFMSKIGVWKDKQMFKC